MHSAFPLISTFLSINFFPLSSLHVYKPQKIRHHVFFFFSISLSWTFGTVPRTEPAFRNNSWLMNSGQQGGFMDLKVIVSKIYITYVQFSSVALSCPTLCNPMNRSMPGLPVHHQLLEFIQTHVHWVSDAIQPSHPLSPLLLLPPIPPSIRVFSNGSTLHMRWPKYWSFSFSISPSKEIPGLISFRMDWLDLLAVQGTLKSLLQHHSSKASILRRSAFFTVQLSHPYMTTGKTIALTKRPLLAK